MLLAILLGSLITLGPQRPRPEFPSAIVALYEFDHMPECRCDTDVKAYFRFTPANSFANEFHCLHGT